MPVYIMMVPMMVPESERDACSLWCMPGLPHPFAEMLLLLVFLLVVF